MTSSFISSLKKVELHRHLDCSIRPQTLRELLKAAGEKVPESGHEFENRYLVKEPMRDLATVLKKFLASQKALGSILALERIAEECILDAIGENIEVLELRFAPTFIQEGNKQLTFEAIESALIRGIQRAQATSTRAPKVGLIYTLQRIKPVTVAEEVFEFALSSRRARPEWVVGLDLADSEDGFDARPFKKIFQQAQSAGFGITIHAAETPPKPNQNAEEDVYRRIATAVEELGAQRIGHGLQSILSPKAQALLRRQKILLEICPTSNWLTGAVSDLTQHPARRLFEAGIALNINTDDPGIFDLSLNGEFTVAQEKIGFSDEQLSMMQAQAKAASFLK